METCNINKKLRSLITLTILILVLIQNKALSQEEKDENWKLFFMNGTISASLLEYAQLALKDFEANYKPTSVKDYMINVEKLEKYHRVMIYKPSSDTTLSHAVEYHLDTTSKKVIFRKGYK